MVGLHGRQRTARLQTASRDGNHAAQGLIAAHLALQGETGHGALPSSSQRRIAPHAVQHDYGPSRIEHLRQRAV